MGHACPREEGWKGGKAGEGERREALGRGGLWTKNSPAMIFQQILNEESGCLSYLIGCGEAGRALVVDPGRDRVPEYLRLAAKKGLTISHILETHTHADLISGNRDLAEAVPAPVPVHRASGVVFQHEEVHERRD